MPQQGVDLGRSSPKGNKRIERGPASPSAEDFVPEPQADGRRQYTLLLEQTVGVSREHLGPFVAVVARGVASGKNVAESMRQPAVILRSRDDRDLASDGVHPIEDRAQARVEIVVKMHVEQCEFELSNRLHPALEISGGEHAIEKDLRQRLPRI